MGQEVSREPVVDINGLISALQIFNERFQNDDRFRTMVKNSLTFKDFKIPLKGAEEEVAFLLKCVEGCRDQKAEMEMLYEVLDVEKTSHQNTLIEFEKMHPYLTSTLLAEKVRIDQWCRTNHITQLRARIQELEARLRNAPAPDQDALKAQKALNATQKAEIGKMAAKIVDLEFFKTEQVARELELETQLNQMSDEIAMILEESDLKIKTHTEESEAKIKTHTDEAQRQNSLYCAKIKDLKEQLEYCESHHMLFTQDMEIEDLRKKVKGATDRADRLEEKLKKTQAELTEVYQQMDVYNASEDTSSELIHVEHNVLSHQFKNLQEQNSKLKQELTLLEVRYQQKTGELEAGCKVKEMQWMKMESIMIKELKEMYEEKLEEKDAEIQKMKESQTISQPSMQSSMTSEMLQNSQEFGILSELETHLIASNQKTSEIIKKDQEQWNRQISNYTAMIESLEAIAAEQEQKILELQSAPKEIQKPPTTEPKTDLEEVFCKLDQTKKQMSEMKEDHQKEIQRLRGENSEVIRDIYEKIAEMSLKNSSKEESPILHPKPTSWRYYSDPQTPPESSRSDNKSGSILTDPKDLTEQSGTMPPTDSSGNVKKSGFYCIDPKNLTPNIVPQVPQYPFSNWTSVVPKTSETSRPPKIGKNYSKLFKNFKLWEQTKAPRNAAARQQASQPEPPLGLKAAQTVLSYPDLMENQTPIEYTSPPTWEIPAGCVEILWPKMVANYETVFKPLEVHESKSDLVEAQEPKTPEAEHSDDVASNSGSENSWLTLNAEDADEEQDA